MKERINKNEERLDKVLESVEELEKALGNFKENHKNFELLNKYYGSKNWFRDKESYEKGEILEIKAGVLSEDAVWNLDERVAEIVSEMEKIINKIKGKK